MTPSDPCAPFLLVTTTLLAVTLLTLGACGSNDDPAAAGDAGESIGKEVTGAPDSGESASVSVDEPTSIDGPDETASAEESAGDETTSTAAAFVEPVATRPAGGGNGPTLTAAQDLSAADYVEEELLFSGDATSYRMVGERTPDGHWDAEPADSAPFTSRLVVRRPVDAASFSGVVIVEWLNVSAGFDSSPDWNLLHREILREGHAWVGVSAQALTVVGGEGFSLDTAPAGGLAASDPERYGSLAHPGDAWSYDIFSNAGRAVRFALGPAPLGDLVPELVVAVGESQSAFFLTTYLNAVHPIASVFDAFLVHSRGGSSPLIEGGDLRSEETPVRIRTDQPEPVLIFQTETDLITLNHLPARQDDTDTVRTWEVAGTAHADAFTIAAAAGVPRSPDLGSILGCTTPINDGPQHEVLQAGFHHLVDWARGGPPPPTSASLEIETSDGGSVIARDDAGIALGGIRTPVVDVPVAAYSGDPVTGAGQGPFCFLFGSTRPFTADELGARYPSPDTYMGAFTDAADAAVDAGFLLRPDADSMIETARAFAETGLS